MQSFTDLPSLDKYLERLDAAASTSDDELRSLFNDFEWRRDPAVHKDSYSAEFDAVVFFESFQRCGDHLKLLRSLERLVAPDGVVVFGGERAIAGSS